jgi:HTH-type transcriptional regulator/antitoxin HigA
MLIKPIRTQKDYIDALANIDLLLDAKPKTTKFDQLEILTVLVEDYERKNYPIDPPDPVEAIKFRMEQMQLTRKDLESCLGSRARVSEIFNHKRTLTLKMIKTLNKTFGIPLIALLGQH